MSRLGIVGERSLTTRAATLTCVAALALCACSPSATPSVSGPQQPAVASGRITQASAEIAFPRTLQAERLVEVRVLTVRDADAVVTSARLESPLFADSPVRDGVVRLFPDWTNRVRVPLGTAVCPAPAGDTSVVLTLTVDGREVTETLRGDDSVLRTINASECAQRAVLDVATPSFGPVTSQDDSRLETTIVLTRGDADRDQPVTLTSMTGNIVFIVTLSGARELAPGADALAVPAVVTVGRCDPHVFAESKKTFVFPVMLAVGGADPAYVEIQPDATARSALQQLFEDCAAR